MRAVLTFHGVDESGSVLSLRREELRRLLRGVRASCHELVSLESLLTEPDRPDRVALTFDDGFRSVHDAALPVLREEDAPATLFLTSGHVGGRNDWRSQPAWAPRFPMLSWAQIEALAEAGVAIEAHTVSHPDLTGLPDDAVREELESCCGVIEARLGRRPQAFAYPYGRFDGRVAGLASEAFRWSLTTRMAALDGPAPDPHRIPRLDTFYLREGWLQDRFGSAAFRGVVNLRAALRRLRGG